MDEVVRTFDDGAGVYHKKYRDVRAYAEGLDLFSMQLPDHAEVLELASGPGNLTRYILNRRPDLKVLATDLSPKMLEIGSAYVPEASFQLLDARTPELVNRVFDGVMVGFLLPYLSHEEIGDWIRSVAGILKNGGCLYISFMEGDPGLSGPIKPSSGKGEGLLTWFHKKEQLILHVKNAGLSVLDIFTTPSPAHYQGVQDMAMVVRK